MSRGQIPSAPVAMLAMVYPISHAERIRDRKVVTQGLRKRMICSICQLLSARSADELPHLHGADQLARARISAAHWFKLFPCASAFIATRAWTSGATRRRIFPE